MFFNKADLIDLANDECSDSDFLVFVTTEYLGKSRWSDRYRLIFQDKATGKTYAVPFSRGATESQDEQPFQYSPDLIDCKEVHAVEKTITVYQ